MWRLVRTKGSEGELTIISDRLRAALEPVRGGTHICHQYTEHGFRSAWARLKKKMIEDGIEPFNFHDIKASGISDHQTNHSAPIPGHEKDIRAEVAGGACDPLGSRYWSEKSRTNGTTRSTKKK